MKHLIIPFAVFALLGSCGSSESNEIKANDGEVISNLSTTSDMSREELKAERERQETEQEKRQEEVAANKTTLKFDKKIHDFGTTNVGVDNTTEFIVSNTGDKPLIIENVSASCGCTTPQKPEQPIPPGKSDVIKVSFKAKEGQLNEINKTVTVIANTVPEVHKLEIKAFVNP